jgi:NTP pyrophosphatase (non-canonical NTP hydrolase)
MSTLMEELRAFNRERDWDQFHSPENLAKSVSIESGELLECFQWDGTHYDKEDVKGELADLLTYAYLLADRLGLDPETIIREKLAVTAKKYPVEKCRGKSTKYDKLK